MHPHQGKLLPIDDDFVVPNSLISQKHRETGTRGVISSKVDQRSGSRSEDPAETEPCKRGSNYEAGQK